MSNLTAGVRVRCVAEDSIIGPECGWLGTVVGVEWIDQMFTVHIEWDLLRGNRAERRKKGGVPLHSWGFESEELALEYLEVVTVLHLH